MRRPGGEPRPRCCARLFAAFAPNFRQEAMSKSETIVFKGLEAYRLSSANGASAVVSRFGAQVLSWRTADGCEQLFLSERARFDRSAPIRGGIPVCFPQFSGLGPLPKHGLLRSRDWALAVDADGAATLCLEAAADAASQRLWPHRFVARLEVSLRDDGLDVSLAVDNSGTDAFAFTAALHSYLAVDAIDAVELHGLAGLGYRDAANGDALGIDTEPCLRFAGEIDRVYHGATAPLRLEAGSRRLGISTSGFPDVVVWNPWAKGCAALADMVPEGYRRMLCVEAAVAHSAQTLAPGASWRGSQRLRRLAA